MREAGRRGDSARCPLDFHGCPVCTHDVQGPAVGGSSDIYINGRPALRVDDAGQHSGCCGPNAWKAAEGSPCVLFNGKNAHRKDDATAHCGGAGKLIEGSPDVLIGSCGLSLKCECTKSNGRWAKLPSVIGMPSVDFLGADWPDVKIKFGFLPTGIKIPFQFLVRATISGKLECACPDRPECAENIEFSVAVPVPITISIPIEIVGALARLVPVVGQFFTAGHIAYVAYRIIDVLGDVAWAFEPAVRIVRESADLICEGKFDSSLLASHVLDIAASVNLD